MSLSAKHIPALDGVRGLAAMTIVIFHYWGGKQNANPAVRFIAEGINFGWASLSLFFVLSGFLISGILIDGFDKQGWWRRFYWRRSLRIFPLYYFALALAIAITVSFLRIRCPLASIVPWVFYLQDIPMNFRLFPSFPNFPALSHLWSLAVEEQFYLLWPFVLVCRRKNLTSARRMCVLIWAISFLFRVSVLSAGLRENWAIGFVVGRAGELAMGAYLALAIRDVRGNSILLRHPRRVFLASLLAILAVMAWSRSTAVSTFPMATIGIAANALLFTSMLALCLNAGVLASFFSMAWLRWLGRISYGIYIYHILLGSLFEWIAAQSFPGLGHDAHLVVVAMIAVPGTLAIAAVSYYAFEARFLRLKCVFSPALEDRPERNTGLEVAAEQIVSI